MVYEVLLEGNRLEESVVYQDIIQRGVELGRQQIQKVWLERWQAIILRQLAQRFGRLSPKVRERVKLLPLPKLEKLFREILLLSDKQALNEWLNKTMATIK